MREFNKIFVIALPRCATVSMCDALGLLGIPTAHLGRIFGQYGGEHCDPKRLIRIHEQISSGDFNLDILRECRGLADYPACAATVFQRLDQQYPGSLFVNVRRDRGRLRWLQSVERQFVGLELVKARDQATELEREFMQVMQAFRAMTFGHVQFDAEVYSAAYETYQAVVAEYFWNREQDLLQIGDVSELAESGFQQLCQFLDCPVPSQEFPNCNAHSQLPQQVFMDALKEGVVESQTGIEIPTCGNVQPAAAKTSESR